MKRDPKAKPTRDREIAEVVEMQQDRLFAIVRKTMRDHDEAEDVLQDVFEDYVEAYDLDEAITSLSGWLATVARNKVLDRFRRKKTQTEFVQSANLEDAFSREQPDQDLDRQILREQIAEALAALPPEQREVFVQNELEGRTFEEIASSSGMKVSTLLARKRYAVQFLREYLKEIYDDYE